MTIEILHLTAQIQQWLNVLGAATGREPLRVPAEEAVKGLAFVEQCYGRRSFMAPPWFTDRESAQARRRHVEGLG